MFSLIFVPSDWCVEGQLDELLSEYIVVSMVGDPSRICLPVGLLRLTPSDLVRNLASL